MVFSKTDTADIEVSYDEAKFNFPHNRSGYRKFLQFIPAKFSNLIRRASLARMHPRHDGRYFHFHGNSIAVLNVGAKKGSTRYSFMIWLNCLKVFLFEVGKQFFLRFNQLSKHLIEKIKKNYFHKSYFQVISTLLTGI